MVCEWERLHILVDFQRNISLSALRHEHIQRFHTPPRLAPPLDFNFSDADAVEECKRRRRRGTRSSEGRQRRPDRREPKCFGPEEFTILHSNVREFTSRVAELSARLRLVRSKPSVLCLTWTWADKGLPTMRIECYTLMSRTTELTADREAELRCLLWMN